MIPFPQLQIAARQDHVFPALQNNALISIGQFCNINFTAVFHKGNLQLSRDGITIPGKRDPSTGMYYIDLPQPPPVTPPALNPFAFSTYEMNTKAELVQYLHRCAFSLVVSTWTKAIDVGYFATWPGLTSELVRKHLPKVLATAKGHLKQDRQNVRSTKTAITPSPIFLPSQHEPPVQYHQVFVKAAKLTGKVSTDQTCHFPITSSCGSKYLMVLYDHDSNTIIPESNKSQSESELI